MHPEIHSSLLHQELMIFPKSETSREPLRDRYAHQRQAASELSLLMPDASFSHMSENKVHDLDSMPHGLLSRQLA